jgi:hypothetical protein
MIDLILLAVGSFTCSASVAYSVWAKIRVRLFRDRLFAIRDQLWVEAYQLGALEDDAYQRARKHLNSHIYLANFWSIKFLEFLRHADFGESKVDETKASSPLLQECIDKANEEAAQLIINYVIFWRASGLLRVASLIVEMFFHASFQYLRQPYVSWFNWLKSPAAELAAESLAPPERFVPTKLAVAT